MAQVWALLSSKQDKEKIRLCTKITPFGHVEATELQALTPLVF